MKSLTIQDSLDFQGISISAKEFSQVGLFGNDPIARIHERPKRGWHRVSIHLPDQYDVSVSVSGWLYENATKSSAFRWFQERQILVVYFENLNDALRFKLVDINDVISREPDL